MPTPLTRRQCGAPVLEHFLSPPPGHLHGPHSGPPSQLSHSASPASELSEITPAANAERSPVRQSSSAGAWPREDGNCTTQPTQLLTGLWSQGNRTANVAMDILRNRPRGPGLQAEERKNSVWLNRTLRRKFLGKSTVTWQRSNSRGGRASGQQARERSTCWCQDRDITQATARPAHLLPRQQPPYSQNPLGSPPTFTCGCYKGPFDLSPAPSLSASTLSFSLSINLPWNCLAWRGLSGATR